MPKLLSSNSVKACETYLKRYALTLERTTHYATKRSSGLLQFNVTQLDLLQCFYYSLRDPTNESMPFGIHFDLLVCATCNTLELGMINISAGV